MALVYPYPLSFLATCLTGGESRVYPKRYDNLYGSRDGRYFGAEVSTPLWMADITLYDRPPVEARKINTRVWALGVNNTFLFADPFYAGPISGTTGLGAITISVIAADKDQVTLTGFPAGYTIRTGDFFSFVYDTDRVYFGTFAQDMVASETGVMAGMPVFPYLPIPAAAPVVIELAQPYFKAIIPPDGYTPFGNTRGKWGGGASISVVQKI